MPEKSIAVAKKLISGRSLLQKWASLITELFGAAKPFL
jgi:hypothetical protein